MSIYFDSAATTSLDPLVVEEMLKYTSINNEAFWSNVLSVALVAYFYKGSRQMHDAIIEGFVAPYSGSYTLTVNGYGTTSGTYTLEIIDGRDIEVKGSCNVRYLGTPAFLFKEVTKYIQHLY